MVLMFVVLLGGCGQSDDGAAGDLPSDTSPKASAEQSPGTGGGETVLKITATDSVFDQASLSAPADKAFKVDFNNTDEFGHSFSVFDKAGGKQIFRGEVFNGPKTLTNDIPALSAGSYHYQCDVHPFIMDAVLKVA